MYRPDFSGFLWTTILCLDNKNLKILGSIIHKDAALYQNCLKPFEKNNLRKGKIVEYSPKIDQDAKIKIINRRVVKRTIDYETSKVIVSFDAESKLVQNKILVLLKNLLNY